jgi:NAD-dependent DNA ligase
VSSQQEALAWLAGAGFTVNPDNAAVAGFSAAVEAAEAWMAGREDLGGWGGSGGGGWVGGRVRGCVGG